jgi:DNA-binding Lrp family transcriptional regulator
MGAVLAPWGFDEHDEVVYRAVLRRPGVTVDALADELDMPVDDVLRTARKLIRGRLIRRRGNGVAGLRPDVALSSLAREAEAELARRRAELDHMETTIAQFMHDHVLGEQDRGAPPGAEILTGCEEVNRAVAELLDAPPGEVLGMFCLPMGQVPLPARSSRCDSAHGGVPMRVLCTPEVLECPDAQLPMVGVAKGLGAVRVGTRLPTKMLLVGGRGAVLPLDWEQQRSDEVLVVRSPALLGALTATFDLIWERATPVGRRAGGGPGYDDALLQLLAEGLQDEAVAEKLGVSVRTVRRRVAELLEDLGARTRFQAGVQAARKGLL